AIIPAAEVVRNGLADRHTVPLVTKDDLELLDSLGGPRMIEIAGWDKGLFTKLSEGMPNTLVGVRIPADTDPVPLAEAGVPVIHLLADHHGHAGGRFMLDLIQEAHGKLVDAGLREQVTLIGSGGIVMAEHAPKAIVCGLDAVGLDTAPWTALQANFYAECVDRADPAVEFPGALTAEWGVKRMRNMVAAWRDQLLEILGAMGLREVRRLRGEVGRCMFQGELEDEAFGEIEGYVSR
ncbi:MAG: glutamate synthase-related protein, partial [Actinobacteria bacterium]|nr:glutamate synthase-related protein [Actinomycetota bacterium]